MEKFFLRRILATDELNIINHQNINRTKLFLERHRIAETKGAHKAVHEFFRRQIHHLSRWCLLADMPRNCMHQMRFAKPDPAI